MRYRIIIVVCLLLTGGAVAQITATTDAAPSLRAYGVELNVDDMDKALAFYKEKLGFEVEDRSGYPELVVLQSGDVEKLILHRVARLRRLSRLDSGLSFTLQVNDLAAAMERMKAAGVDFGEKEIRKEAVGNAIDIIDPFGRPISLMHQTIVKVERFKEPRLYNFGVSVPDMQTARDFYANKLGFVVRSEKYLPLDLPLGHADKSFAFMLHYRPGVRPVKSDYPNSNDFNTLVFATSDLSATLKSLKANGVKLLFSNGTYALLEDPFGTVSKVMEVKAEGRKQ